MSIHVQLERFEGPLGLLLHLIREQEMDIFNINIHQITRQYLEYIKTMRRLDLEVAGEFVAMAATLLHIKSRMLLPQYNEEGEVITEDPRKELVQKLVEYKKMQEFAQELYKRPLLGRDVYTRGEIPETELESTEEGELILEENPLFSLISSFRTAMRNMKKGVHTVASSMKSIAERILEIKDYLIIGKRIVMRDLITEPTGPGNQVLLTFLSLLELAKMGFISVFQSDPFSDIFIDPKKIVDRDVVSQVESYDSVNAQAKADEIINEAQLSLDEPVAQFEGEEAPVVEASFADAATDEEIAREEAMLDGGIGLAAVEGPGQVAEEIRAEETFLESTNGPNIMGFEDENRTYDPSLVPHTATEEVAAADAVAEEVAAAETVSEEAVAESLSDEVVVEAVADEAVTEAVAEELAVETVEMQPSVEATEPMVESIVAENVEVLAESTTNESAEQSVEEARVTTRSLDFFPQMIQEMPQDFMAVANEMEVAATVEEAMPSTNEATISEPAEEVQVSMKSEDIATPEEAVMSEVTAAPEVAAMPSENVVEAVDHQADAIEHAAPATDVVDQYVSSALSQALAAFDSFNEIEAKNNEPETPATPEEKPPEVES